MSAPVVSATRKRPPIQTKATNRYDQIPNKPEPSKLFDAGGEGRDGLTLEKQAEVQLNTYVRTLELSDLFFRNVEQETRQTRLVDDVISLTVSVAREDFPAVSADITIGYTQSAAQAAWRKFLVDVRVALNLEFIEDILDRMDLAPIHRIMRLRDGGQYFVKQREASAILEVIESGKLPQQVSWSVTQGINIAKENLVESGSNQRYIDKRVDEIINQPLIRENQRLNISLLAEAENAQQVLHIMFEMMHAVDLPPDEMKIALEQKAIADEEARVAEADRINKMNELLARGASAAELLALNSAAAIKPVYVATKTYDKEVDIVLLHRVAFETLSRLAARHREMLSNTAHTSFEFIHDTLVTFRHEIDVVLMGIKLIGELADFLMLKKKEMFVVVCDTVQCYAPPPLFYIPRVIHRLLSPEELAEEERIFNAQFAFEDEDEFVPELVDDQERVQQQLAALGVSIVGGEEEEGADDDTTVDEVKVEEEVEEVEEEEEEDEVARVRGPNEKKPWKGSYGFVGKPYKKTLKDRDESELSLTDFFGGEGGDQAPASERKNRKKSTFKPAKFTLRPLPWTKGIIHRGFTGSDKYKSSMILLQCFATLYKIVSLSYGFREQAFNLFLHEEVCDIAVVSVGMPRLLEYTIWIVDRMYADGFISDDNAEEEALTVDPSMNFSAARLPKVEDEMPENDDVQSIDPVTGMVIEAVSTITQPSVDLNGVNREVETPRPNITGEDDQEPWYAGPITKEDEPENITGSIALDPEAKDREDMAKKIAQGIIGAQLKQQMGDKAFNRRYRGRPKDVVIIALGLISEHLEVPQRDRDSAKRLLSLFDDCSASFKFLAARGAGLNGL